MINKSLVCRDIEAVLNSTKCFYGSYAELHRYDYKGSQTKMDEFISIAKLRFGENTEKALLRDKVILPNIDGGYDFNFVNVSDAGGITYSNKDWHAVLYYDVQDFYDRYTVYHELAHVIQESKRLFNPKIVNDIFQNNFSNYDYEKISGKKKYKLQYLKYLKETHAEVFAAACLLLRAKNFPERINLSRRIKARIGKMFLNGFDDGYNTYTSRKFYTDFNSKLRVVKDVNRWYRNGEVANFIDKQGNIDFENLALKVQDIVLKNIDSPKEFYDLLYHNSFKQGTFYKAKLFKMLDPKWLRLREVENLRISFRKHQRISDNLLSMKFQSLPETDEDAAIVNTVCRLDRAYTKIIRGCTEYSVDVEKFKYFNSENAVNYGRVPDSIQRVFLSRFFQDYDQDEGEKIFGEYQREVNNAIFDSHADAEITAKIAAAMRDDPNVRSAVWNMYRQRQQNPNAKISPKDFAYDFPVVSHKQQQKKELAIFNRLKYIFFKKADDFSDVEVHAIRKKIINLAECSPEKMENIDVTDIYQTTQDDEKKQMIKLLARHISSSVHALYYIDKDAFNNVMIKYAATLRKLNDKTIGDSHFYATKTKNNSKCH